MARPSGSYELRPGGEPERRALLDVKRQFVDTTRWRGDWSAGRYKPGDMVRDDGWTMVCANRGGCTDKPAPTPVGEPLYLYNGDAPTVTPTVPQVVYGQRLTVDVGGGYIRGYRLWTAAGARYVVYSVLDPDGEGIVTQIATFTAAETGWVELSLAPTLIGEGTTIALVVVAQQPDPAPTPFVGNWDYQLPQTQPEVPTAGQILHRGASPDQLRIHKTDADGGDRSADLAGIDVGDTIAGAGLTWTVQATQDNGAWITFVIAPAVQGTPGLQSFTFNTYTPQPIEYVEDIDHWIPDRFPRLTVRGFVGPTFPTVVVNDNGYGADLLIQDVQASDEWEAISAPSVAAGGGGGSVPNGLPVGGTTGQHLAKATDDDYDAEWVDLPPGGDPDGLPVGGTTGQHLAKASDADYDAEWVDLPGGGNGVAQPYSGFYRNTNDNPVLPPDTDVIGNFLGGTLTNPPELRPFTKNSTGIIIPASGIYAIVGTVEATGFTAGAGRLQLGLRVNNAVPAGLLANWLASGGTNAVQVTRTMWLQAGWWVNMLVRQIGGGSSIQVQSWTMEINSVQLATDWA